MNQRGCPIGPGCLLDLESTFAQLFSDFVLAARDVKAQQKSGETVTFAPPSSVVHSGPKSLVVSIRSAFCTESEVVKLLGSDIENPEAWQASTPPGGGWSCVARLRGVHERHPRRSCAQPAHRDWNTGTATC